MADRDGLLQESLEHCRVIRNAAARRTGILPAPYRHSRVSGNPTVACRQYHHKTVPFGIPAYAGMTVGR